MLRFLGIVLSLAIGSAAAAGPAEVARLISLSQVEDVTQIMAVEGQEYGDELTEAMFGGVTTEAWGRAVETIYDAETMTQVIASHMHDALDAQDVSSFLAYLESPGGLKATRREVEARRAMVDPAVESSARQNALHPDPRMRDRLDQIDAFIAENDLIDRNVESALNSNFAFMTALTETGGAQFGATEADLLRDLWNSEPSLREDTEEWMRAYMLLAYGGLSDAEFLRYAEATASPAGQAVFRAGFAAYDALYLAQSRALGLAAGAQLTASAL